MAAVREGVSSCGGTSMPSASHLLPIPCTSETTAISRASLVSSAAGSKVSRSRGAACDAADPKPKPEVEASAGRRTKTMHEIPTTGARRGRYGSRPASSYGAGSLNRHRSASPSPSIRGGDQHREPHGGEGASSSVSLSQDRRLPTIEDSAKTPAILQNIRLQKTRQPFLLHRRGALSGWRYPKVSGKENEVCDHLNRQPDTVSSGVSSAKGANQVPRRSIHRALALSTHQTQSSNSCSQHMSEIDAINGWRFPKVSKEEDKGCGVTVRCLRQSFPTTSNSSNSALVPLGKLKDKAANVHSAHISGGTVGARKKEAYITTLGAGGGYGDPHPPPFYKCEVCCKGTAFYRLKCCHLVVCERCGCACEPSEAAEDNKLQYRREKVLAGKEKLPEVKLEGSDLFLWQPCSFPSGLMLCKAKRSGNQLQYYFAPVDELMNPEVKVIRATVYNFRQQGRNARSLSVAVQSLSRNQLR